ncbi:MAG: hypothetical protein ACWGHO_05455 [Candidatus Moraniibacteriota bacterium]
MVDLEKDTSKECHGEGEMEYDDKGRPICSLCKNLLSEEDAAKGYENCEACDQEKFNDEFYEYDFEQSLREVK